MPRSPTPKSSLIGVIMPADDVLVDLVDEQHEAEHPHRLGEEADEERRRWRDTGSPAGSSGVGDATSRVSRGDQRRRSGPSMSGRRRRIGHGGRFCTTGAISWPATGRQCSAASGRGADRASRWCWPWWRRRRGASSSGASGPAAPIRTGYAVPGQRRPRRLRPARRAVARRGVHVGHVRLVRGRVGAGPAARERRRWRCRSSSTPRDRDAARALRDRRRAGHRGGRRRGRRGGHLRRTGDGHRPVGDGRRGPRAGHDAATSVTRREAAGGWRYVGLTSELACDGRVGAERAGAVAAAVGVPRHSPNSSMAVRPSRPSATSRYTSAPSIVSCSSRARADEVEARAGAR